MSVQRDNIQLDVTINGNKAGKTLRDLQKDSRSLNRELSQLTPGTEEFIEKSNELQKVNTRLNGIRATTRGGLREIRESADAINRYGEEGGKQLIALRDKSRQLEQQLATLEPTSQEFIDTAKQYGQVNEEIQSIEGSVSSLGGQFTNLPGPIGGAIRSIRGMTVAAKAFIATPLGLILGAIAAALAAVRAALTSSEEGQNRLNKATAIVNAVLSKFNEVLANVGNLLLSVFKNPQQALQDFGQAIQTFLINRFQDVLSGVRGLGRAVSLLFEFEFKEAAEAAGKAVLDLTTGLNPAAGIVRDASGAVQEFYEGVVDGAEKAQRAADKLAKADKLARELVVERAEAEQRIADLRLKARQEDQFSAEERAAFLQDAIDVQDDLFGKEQEVLELRRDAQILQNQISTDTKKDLDAEAEAIADVTRAETRRINSRRQLERQLQSLRNQSGASGAAQEETEDQISAQERQQELLKEHLKEIDAIEGAAELDLRLRRSQGLISEQEFNDKLNANQIEALNERIETLRAFGEQETEEFTKLLIKRNELDQEQTERERQREEKESKERIEAKRESIEAEIREEDRLLREKFLQQLITEEELEEMQLENRLNAVERRLEFMRETGMEETELFRELQLEKLEIENEIDEQREENAKRRANARIALEQETLNNSKAIISESISLMKQEGKEKGKQFGLIKAFEAAQIKLNLISEIQKIFNSFASLGPLGQVLAVVQAAAAGVRAKRALSNLSSINYNTGGEVGIDPLSGQRITQKPNVPTQPGGDNILAYVKRGEVILNEKQQRLIGGARTFRRIGVPGFNTGGITSLNTTPAPVGVPEVDNTANDANAGVEQRLDRLIGAFEQFPRELRAKMVLSEFEEVKSTYDDIEDQANL